MENIPESTGSNQEPTPTEPTEQTHKPVPARTHDAEITHNRVGPHPMPETAGSMTVGEMADWFWTNRIWPSIVQDYKDNPKTRGM